MTTPVVLALALFLGADSPPPEDPVEKLFLTQRTLVPAAEVAIFHIGLSAFNRFVLQGDYAYTSFDTIYRNFEMGPRFDNDDVFVNFLGHPYHSSIIFNFPRSMGIGFWGSFLTVVFEAFVWEWLGEAQAPSVNDMVESSIGGSMWGEVFHRLATRMFAPDGPFRVLRGVAAFALDPSGAMNIGMFGTAPENVEIETMPMRGRLYAGGLNLGDSGFEPKAMLGADVVAGLGPTGHGNCVLPFDVFRLRADVGFVGTQAIDATIIGLLGGCGFGDKGPAGDWGFFGGTEFQTNAGFRWGGTHLGPGAMLQWEGPNARLALLGTAGVVAMGASGTFEQTDYRNTTSLSNVRSRYTMGFGFMGRAGAELTLFKLLTLEAHVVTWGLAAETPVQGWEEVDQVLLGADLALPASQLIGGDARWARRLPAQPTDVKQEGWTVRAFWGFHF